MSKSSEHMIQQAALQAKAKAAHALHHNPERDRMQPKPADGGEERFGLPLDEYRE